MSHSPSHRPSPEEREKPLPRYDYGGAQIRGTLSPGLSIPHKSSALSPNPEGIVSFSPGLRAASYPG